MFVNVTKASNVVNTFKTMYTKLNKESEKSADGSSLFAQSYPFNRPIGTRGVAKGALSDLEMFIDIVVGPTGKNAYPTRKDNCILLGVKGQCQSWKTQVSLTLYMRSR